MQQQEQQEQQTFNFVDEFIKDFSPDLDIFRYLIIRCKSSMFDFGMSENSAEHWIEYYRNNPHELYVKSLFDNFFITNLPEKINKIFNGNDEYYFTKYNNIPDQFTPFSLAEYLWNKRTDVFLHENITKTENIMKIIPHLPNLKKIFIFQLFEQNTTICDKILEHLDYELPEEEQNVLYSRGEVEYLAKIKLGINNYLLQKALVYGRANVIELLDQKGLLSKHDNPFGLELLEEKKEKIIDFNTIWKSKYYSTDDIWYGLSWGNDECERDYIGGSDYKKCFQICMKYFEFRDEYVSAWMYKKHRGYGPNINEIVGFFIDIENMTKSKQEIANAKNRFGKKVIWDILRNMNANILDVLLD